MLRVKSWIIGSGLQLFSCFTTFSLISASTAWTQTLQTNLAAIVRHAPNLNGSGIVEGSLQQLLGESITLNGGFTMTGDFLVPGTPTLRQNGHPDFGGIIDGNGSNLPGGYRVTLNGNCSLRYLRTQINPVSLPEVALPPRPAGSRNVTIGNPEESIGDPITLRNLTLNGSVGQFAIPPGTYGNFIANGGSGFILGVAGATQPAIYNLQNLTLNGQSRLEIAGPIVLTVANGFTANGILGSSNNPASLQLQLASGGLTLNGGCTVYGSVTAPGGTVIINGNSRLVGSIQCDRLIVNSGGIIRAGGAGNQPPIAHSQDLATDEDESIPIALTGSDPDGASLSFSLISQPAHGMLSGSAPDLVYTPTKDFNGNDSFTFKVNDGQADSATAEISITVEPINDVPVAHAQMQTTTEDTALDLVLAGTDLDGDALSFAIVMRPSHGNVSGLAPNLTYTPAPDFSGSDSFQFSVNDGQAGATNVVTIHVSAVNDQPFANAQQVVTDEDVSVPVTLTGADAEGSALMFNLVGQPQHGTLSGVLPDLIYTPGTNFNGADAFGFQVSDGTLTSAVATVTLSIRPINDPPVAESRIVITPEDSATNVILTATDPEGNSLQFNLTSTPENGTLNGVAPHLVFSPAADFHGTNSFEFTANDGSATSALVVVTLIVTPVNDRPLADAKSVTLDEDAFTEISLSGSDADGDALTYTITIQPTNGSLSGIPPNLIYTPATNYSGSDSFSYQTNDGKTNSESAFVALSILPINDAPAGKDDLAVTDEDTPLQVTLRANDIEGDALSFDISTPPTHGELTGVAPDLIYTPETNYYGADTFRFVVHDGQTNSGAATILITINAVNDRPVAMNESVETLEDGVAPVALGANDVDGDLLNIQIITGPAHGSLTGNPPNLTYVPAADFFGNDAFTFLANDGQAESAPATITLNVAPMNDPPRLTVPGNQTIAEDAALVFNTNQPIVLSDIDVGVGFLKLSVSATNGTISLGATNGLIFEVGMDRSTNIVVTGSLADLNAALAGLTYLGRTNFSGSDVIVLLADDQGNSGVGENLTDLKTIALTITPVNEPPVANGMSLSTAEDSSVDFTLSGSDTEGSALNFLILSQPSHGVLAGTAPDLVYTPATNFHGSDSFMFRVNDGEEDSPPAIVELTIAPVNDPPMALAQSVNVMEGQSVPITLRADDVDGDGLSFVITQQPHIGVVNGSGSNFVYTANTGTYGSDSFDFYVSDGGTTSIVATVPVYVSPFARGRTYTLNNDFEEGELISLLATNEDLQTTIDLTHFNYVWVPVQSRGTVMRLDAETGRVLGEYHAQPDGRPNGYPSRVAVDQSGNCWVANERDNSIIMIAAPESGSWVDKNHDGKLTTSQGQGDILPWTNPGGVDNAGGVSSAEDELIAHYVRVTDSGVRHISISRAGDLWVSGTATHTFDLIDHLNGQIIRTEQSIGRGGFGGFVDDNDVLWSAGTFLSWDTHLPLSSAATSAWNSVPEGSFASAQDSQGNMWVTYESGTYRYKVLKFAPSGVRLGEYTHGGGWGQGIAIDNNDDVWIAYSHCGYGVGHLKNDGTLVGSVRTAHGPTAISIDRKGRIWVSTTGGIVQRINPAGGPIGKDGLTPVGEVELTSPYLGGYLWTYGDFTGSASALRTQRGLWTVVFDSGLSNAPWAPLQWNATLWNDGTLPMRVATSEDGTNFTALQSITLEDSQPATLGRYLKIAGDFIPATSGDGSVLHDLTVGTVGWDISPAITNWQISAGQDFDAYWPDAVQLKGAVAHSAHNVSVNPIVEWTLVSGPGSVNFDNAQSIQPTLHFSTNGVYVFRITANNRGEIQTDEVTVSLTPYNRAPWAEAGPNLFVADYTQNTILQGTVRDDGLPLTNTLQVLWTQLFGPGTTLFENSTSAVTSATFSTNGIYILQLSADDGEYKSTALVTVRVGAICTVSEMNGLQAWWQANGTGDDHANGNQAFLENGATYVQGKVGAAFNFDGIDDSVSVGSNPHINLAKVTNPGFTVEFWMNPNSFQSGSVLGWANGVRVERYGLGYTGDTLRFYVTGTGGGQYVEAPRVWHNTLWSWTHVALTYDRAIGQAKIYINGVLTGTAIVGTNLLSTADEFYLGQVPGSAGVYKGQLDEVSLYSRTLNPQEIYEIYASADVGKCPLEANQAPSVNAGADLFVTGVPGAANLKGEVFDDGLPVGSSVRIRWSQFSGPGAVTFSSPTSAVSSVTFSTNGIYVLKLTAEDGDIQSSDLVEVRVESLCTINDPEGLAAWWPGNGTTLDLLGAESGIQVSGASYLTGKVASAFFLDGVNDSIWMLARTNYDVGSSASGFTVEFWMNPNSFQSGSVLGWAHGVRVERYGLGYTGDTLRFYVTGTGGGQYVEAPWVWHYTSWSWTHVALTYDRGSGQAKIYINGVLKGAATVGTNLLSTAGDFYLGQVPGSANFFSGQLDEVSLYKRPLDPEEVYNVFASGSVGKCPNDDNTGPVVYAGPDISLLIATNAAALNGIVLDDALPNGSSPRIDWNVFNGPGSVIFSDPTSAVTTATFSTNGIYVLQLSADDGEISNRDLVVVRVGTPCSVSDPIDLSAFWSASGTAQDAISGAFGILGGGVDYAGGKVASAFNFDGADDYVWMLARTNYNVGSSTSGFTVEFWINPNSFQNGSVLGWANGVRVERYALGYTGDTLRFYVAGTGNGQYSEAPRVWNYTSWSWMHVALTYDRTLGQAKIYINGVLKGAATVGTNLLSTAGDFYLGQVPGSANFFSGQLDEVSLYTRPLSLSEIQAIFDAGSSGKCLSPANQPPTVAAGADRTIYLPSNTVTLNGAVFDDGLPSEHELTIAWNYIGGGSTVFFSSTNTASTTITFTNSGVYTFELSASDGQFTTNDTVVVTVGPDPRLAPVVAITGPADGAFIEIASGQTTNLQLLASASDTDGFVTNLEFFVNGVSAGSDEVAPFSILASNFAAGRYSITAVAVDNDGLSNTSAPISVTVYVDSGAPTVAVFSPLDATIITAPARVIGTAFSPLLQSYSVRYRFKQADGVPSAAWTVLESGSTSVISNSIALFDPTMLLNGIYEIQVTATDALGRTGLSEIRTLMVDRNLKIGHFTIAFNDLTVPAAGLPIQITRTYDSRAAAAGIAGDFGLGWTMDIRNVRLQKNRPLGRNWEETSSGGGFTAYSLDPGQQRIVSITFPDGRQEKFRFEPNPLVQIIEPIEFPQWRFTPIGNTRGTLVPAGFDEPDGNFLWVVGSVPGPVDIYDLNFLSENPFATEAELNRYPTLFRYTSAEGVRYLIDEIDGLQSIADPNGNTLLLSTNGLTWTNSAAGTNKLSITFERNGQGYITNIVDAAGHAMSYRYSTNGNLVGFTARDGTTNGFAYIQPAFPHHLTSIIDARGVAPVQNEYDAAGRLTGNIDAFGAAVSYGHDLANNREYVTNRLGEVTTTEYDNFGNVTRAVDANGAETDFTYDENGNLLQTIDPLGRTNRYTYDSLDNRLSVTDPLGNTTRFTYGARRRVTSVTDPRGNTITNTFDAQGNLTSMRDPLGNVTRFAYDAQGSPIAVTNALGHVMRFGYDPKGRLISESDPLGHSVSYVRDANGNLLVQTTTRTTSSGLETLNVQFFYDAQSRLTNSIFPDGSSAQTIYNAIGKPAIVIDQQGRQTLMEYDDLGRTIRTVYPDGASESVGYDAEGRRISSTNRLGQVTRYFYDAVGRLTRTVMPDGAGTTNWFDLAGQLIVSSDARGNNTFYGYDAAGRSVTVTNALGQVSLSQYDVSGNMTNAVDALGRSTTFVYDELNRRVKTVFADGTTQTTQFDESGRRIQEQDQAGNVTAFGYDALGRMTAITNALGFVTSYTYDELGQQISQTDANNHTTRFEYDSLGRRTKRVLPGHQIETCAYNVGGLLVNKTDFNGYVTTFQYDVMNRLVAKIPDTRLGEANVTYQYNALGLRTNMTDASGVTDYEYDGRNRLAQKIKMWSGVALSIALDYSYDANGNLIHIVSSDPNGTDISYEYDALNRLSAVNDAKVGRTAYSYDDIGNLQDYTYPNGVHTAYHYDSLNRLTNLVGSKLLTPIADYAYAVGPVGNRLTAIETVQKDGVPHTINRIYTYDNIYRLTGETINGTQNGAVTYNYDPVGNRLSRGVLNVPIMPQTFNFDSNDRVASDSFDLNGNTLFSPGFGQSQPDRYDFENRLVARQTTTNLVEIGYDGDGARVSKKVTAGGVTTITYYVVDELNPSGYAQVLEEHISVNFQSPAISCIYTYGQTLISQDRLDGSIWRTSFYGYDGHNNVRYLTDLNGIVTDTYDYDAFGNLIARTGSTENHYLFTGEQFDPDLNLYYLRARYHNPDTGRFWTQDSFEGNGSDPASLHKYAYCGNNPINAYDPSGNLSIAELGHSSVIGGLTTAWISSISRAVGAASAGAGWKESLDAANEGIADDFASGALGGALGYGIGKAAFWAIGKTAPYLLQWTPEAIMSSLNSATSRLSRAWQVADAAWAKLEKEITFGMEASAQAVRNVVAEAEARIVQLSEKIQRIRLTLGWSDDLAVANNPVSLGHWPDYIDTARYLGTRPFDVPTSVWQAMNPAEQWAANERFLDRAIARGDSFFLSTPLRSLRPLNRAGDETGYWKELQYLIKKGYRLSADGRFLVPQQY
ncbi:MAG TPA: Ig-like domain-containing protein [Verrucomicrobiae bacterium]|nr:Ig-like domain-containing protein [Verrucomicrobiae bacterium]